MARHSLVVTEIFNLMLTICHTKRALLKGWLGEGKLIPKSVNLCAPGQTQVLSQPIIQTSQNVVYKSSNSKDNGKQLLIPQTALIVTQKARLKC